MPNVKGPHVLVYSYVRRTHSECLASVSRRVLPRSQNEKYEQPISKIYV